MKIIRQVVLDQINAGRKKYAEEGFPAVIQLTAPCGQIAYVNLLETANFNTQVNSLPVSCYDETASFEEVVEAVRKEREHQKQKYGADRQQSLAGFIMILEEELREAKIGWCKNSPGKSAPLNELVQVAAVAFAALERYGVTGNTFSRNDVPDPQ